MKYFDKEVIRESGFVLELSNHGKKPKENPNPLNPKQAKMKCLIPSCKNYTKSMFGRCTEHSKTKIQHTVDWCGRLIQPKCTREQCLNDILPHDKVIELLVTWMDSVPERQKLMDRFVEDTLEELVGKIPDSTTLQRTLLKKENGILNPDGIIKLIRNLVDRRFPKRKFENVLVSDGTYHEKPLEKIPIRVAAALIVLAWACEEANRSDLWWIKHFKVKTKSQRASAYMPSVYYLLRRYTKATPEQARISLRSA